MKSNNGKRLKYMNENSEKNVLSAKFRYVLIEACKKLHPFVQISVIALKVTEIGICAKLTADLKEKLQNLNCSWAIL